VNLQYSLPPRLRAVYRVGSTLLKALLFSAVALLLAALLCVTKGLLEGAA